MGKIRGIFLFLLLVINLRAVELTEAIVNNISNKIEYALKCNAKITSISDMELNDYNKVTNSNNIYRFYGTYKAVLSTGIHLKWFSLGDEFHPISSSFVAYVKINNNGSVALENVYYKFLLKKGQVRRDCLLKDE